MSSAPQESSGETTIRTSTEEVLLDVVVRDSHGKLAKGLQASDFKVLEDGVPRDIKSFQFVQGRDVAEEQRASGNSKSTATPVNPLRSVNLVCIVYQNLDPSTKKNAVDATREFLQNHFTPNTWFAVFNLDSSTLTVLQPFTTNRAELLQAANHAFVGRTFDFVSSSTAILNASPNMVTIDEVASGTAGPGGNYNVATSIRVTGGELNTKVNNDASVGDDPASRAQRGDLAGQRRQFGGVEGMRQLDQILELISKLQTLPGRKSVLLVNPGLRTTGDADAFKAMLDKANHADITFYGLDVNGLTENSNVQAANQAVGHAAALSAQQSSVASGMGSGGVNMERMRQGDYLINAVRTSDLQAGLRALAEGTGGFLIGSTNDYRKPFQRVIEDIDTHYEISYQPAPGAMNGRLRSIEVKMSRPDLRAESRTGYYALPALGNASELQPYEMTALAALSVKTPPRTFGYRTAALHFRPSASSAQGELAFEIPVANLTAVPEPQSKHHQIHVAVVALVKDANGDVVEKFNRDAPYDIPDDKFEAVKGSSIMFSDTITLPPGHYGVDAVVLDREANRPSVSSTEFEVPRPQGVGISSVTLVQHVDNVPGKVDPNDPFEFQAQPTEGRRVTPELGTNLRATAKPYVYFVVYPDSSITDKPKIQVEFRVAGKVLARQTADLPPGDSNGAIPMLIGAATKPGECELRITALQGSSQATQSLTYTVASN